MISNPAVFPIIRRRHLFEESCGTGCFVGADGLLLTCSHTLEGEEKADYFICQSPYDFRQLVPIEWLLVDNELDIAIGHIGDSVETPHLPVAAVLVPNPGAAVTTLGFSYVQYRSLWGTYMQTQAVMESIAGTYQFHTNEINPIQGGMVKRFPAIATIPPLVPGFSGAPVLNELGELIGMHSVAALGKDGVPSVAFNVRLDAIGNCINLVRGYDEDSIVEAQVREDR